MSKRKFTGVLSAPKAQCRNCKNLEQCHIKNNSMSAKEIVVDCEGFYYIFKELEKFEQYSAFDGNIEKHTEEMLAYEKTHDGFSNFLQERYGELGMTTFMEKLYQEAAEIMKDMLFQECPGNT